jgi:hypothetical protein
LVEAIRHPADFPPQTCRTRVLAGGFTHLDMARQYLQYYERVLTQGRLGEADEPLPGAIPGFNYRQPLPWDE